MRAPFIRCRLWSQLMSYDAMLGHKQPSKRRNETIDRFGEGVTTYQIT